ncbi:unnamed protein product [Schistosoma curassoni]|uniref:Reverse transcriptase domain-containing protein n=1 Tax=Schistosoma curassoni TaxID=6186 RepID=A0A183JPT2_9TREM|nr:unnamed protein product [Schistosoma curassoni]
MLKKTTSLPAASVTVGLNIHKEKSKILRYNKACTDPITIEGEALEDVKTFIYLGSIIDDHSGGSDEDVKARIGKSRANQNFQYKCQNTSTIWGGNLENCESHHSEDTNVYSQLSTQNTSDPLAGHY